MHSENRTTLPAAANVRVSGERAAATSEQIADGISTDELLTWTSFTAWCAVWMFPLLFWLNGPAVSSDQWYFRTVFWTLAGILAVATRVYLRHQHSEQP